MFSPSSPLTGLAITGLTSPTYTLTVDTSPDVNSKQWAVTALGGTQVGASAHTPEKPFTMTIRRPKTLKVPGARNGTTGQFVQTGNNEYTVILRKGVNILNGYSNVQNLVSMARITFVVPVGTGNDIAELKALMSCLGGLVSNQGQGIMDTLTNGVL